MAYKALYRTYRPQAFSEIIGQDIIVRTLQNEIKENKVSHAYLFSGPRGTGKTSVARIFAKTLNCVNQKDQEPCNECSTCLEITNGGSPDVIEIDAASNNGVDEIRDIKDRIKFLPAGAKYKIYIIDEVHMLSTNAFNALLKTLEEPPKHAIFILATTEPHKILPTVMSRCQRYDFKSLTPEEILSVLKTICAKENINYDIEALKHIAVASGGGLRDAVSFLDQAISLCENMITDEDAASVTGTLGKEKVLSLATSLRDKKLIESLDIIHDLQNTGKEISKIISGLLEFYRDVLLCNNMPSSFNDSKYIEFGKSVSSEEIFYYIDILNDVQSKIRFTTTPSIYLEVAVIKIVQSSKGDFDYKKRIDELEEKLANVKTTDIGSPFDSGTSQRMDAFEEKYNNLLSYLSKLELAKVNDRLKQLEAKETSSTGNGHLSLNKELELQVNKIIEDISLLKITQNSLRNVVENQDTGGLSEEEITAKIEEIAKKVKPTINYTDIEDFLKKQLDYYLEKKLPKALENTITTSNDVQNKILHQDGVASQEKEVTLPIGLEDRITKIESNIYKLMSGTLYSQQTTSKKSKPKVDEKQLSFWQGDVVDVDKLVIPATTKKVKFDKELLKDANTKEQVTDEKIEVTLEDNSKEINSENIELDFENTNEKLEDKDFSSKLDNENLDSTEYIENEEDGSKEFTDDKELEDKLSLKNDEEFGNNQEVINEANDDEVQEEKKIDVLDALEGSINFFNESYESNTRAKQIEKERIAIEDKRKSELEEQVRIALEKKRAEKQRELELGKLKEEVIPQKNEFVQSNEQNKFVSSEDEFVPQEDENSINENDFEVVEESGSINVEDDYDEYEKYDIKILERILNDSRSQDASERERMTNLWKHLISLAPTEKRGVAEILSEGEVKAVGNHEFVLLYSSPAICNQVMSRRFKRSALKLLYDLLDGDYNYLALPKDLWLVKREEYAAQYVTGTKYPKLTPFNDPRLKVNNLESFESDEGMVKKVFDIFGSNVKVKKKEDQ